MTSKADSLSEGMFLLLNDVVSTRGPFSVRVNLRPKLDRSNTSYLETIIALTLFGIRIF